MSSLSFIVYLVLVQHLFTFFGSYTGLKLNKPVTTKNKDILSRTILTQPLIKLVKYSVSKMANTASFIIIFLVFIIRFFINYKAK